MTGQASLSEKEKQKHYQEVPEDLAPDSGENDLQNNMRFSERNKKIWKENPGQDGI